MKVGHEIEADNANWSFDGDVAKTFVSHIRQSVPMYEEGHELVCKLSDYFIHDDSLAYELGCPSSDNLRQMAS